MRVLGPPRFPFHHFSPPFFPILSLHTVRSRSFSPPHRWNRTPRQTATWAHAHAHAHATHKRNGQLHIRQSQITCHTSPLTSRAGVIQKASEGAAIHHTAVHQAHIRSPFAHPPSPTAASPSRLGHTGIAPFQR
jgi:hypothetical protein